MNAGDILVQNIDLIVFGPAKERLVDFLNINKSSVETYTKKSLTKRQNSKSEQNEQSSKTEELSKLQLTYFSKINKLQDLQDENKSVGTKVVKDENQGGKSREQATHYFTWGDFKKTTTTISTLNFWINVNFCLISDMFLDPYINSVLTGNLNILIITFNPNEKESCKKALTLYLKLETDKPPSSIKYQSQRLLLQQGYYHSYNENIVLALCDMPNIEPLGKCLLVGFGDSEKKNYMEQAMKELHIKTFPKVIILEETASEESAKKVVETYDWIIESHQKMKGDLHFDDQNKKELQEAIRKNFLTKSSPARDGCNIF